MGWVVAILIYLGLWITIIGWLWILDWDSVHPDRDTPSEVGKRGNVGGPD